jgi:hypothetical protein
MLGALRRLFGTEHDIQQLSLYDDDGASGAIDYSMQQRMKEALGGALLG